MYLACRISFLDACSTLVSVRNTLTANDLIFTVHAESNVMHIELPSKRKKIQVMQVVRSHNMIVNDGDVCEYSNVPFNKPKLTIEFRLVRN